MDNKMRRLAVRGLSYVGKKYKDDQCTERTPLMNYCKAIQMHLHSTFHSASNCKTHLLYASDKCLPSAKTIHAHFIGEIQNELAFRNPSHSSQYGSLSSPPKRRLGASNRASRAFRILSRARNTTRRPSSRRAKTHLHHSEKTAEKSKRIDNQPLSKL